MPQKITTCLWFGDQLEEAIEFYASLFPDSKVAHVTPGPDGKAVWASFNLAGQEFMGLNGARETFSETISLFVLCEDQEEVDDLWAKLTADGGEESMCGWLKDRFGVSWQIIPAALPRLLGDPDPDRAGRAMQAMLTMQKIDVAALEKAAAGT